MEFSDPLKYENIIEHVLVRACKIHESVTYKALFSPLFNLVKNEERLELTFLDPLKLNKKGKEEFHSLGYKQWKHVILEQSTL